MSIPVLPTTDVKFVTGTIGLFGAAPGAAYLAEFKTFNADPNVTMTALAGLVSKDAAKLAATVVANLGLTGAAATAGTAYLTGEFNANPTNHGKVVIDALLTLTTLTADATFGAAATAVTAMINKGAAYSAVAANTSKDITVLKAAIVAGATNPGTAGVDNGTFTATTDTVNVTATTLNAGDTYVDPSVLDTDVLNLNFAGNLINPFSGVRIVNVETININAQGLVGQETLTPVFTGIDATTQALDNASVNTTQRIGALLDFVNQTQVTGTKTITVSGDSRGAHLQLRNVRDEVTLVDASRFSDDNSESEGILLNFFADINRGTTTTAHTILGSTGTDTITSGDGADSIVGDRGADAINGGGGNDTISGGAGADTIWGADGNDNITGGAGADQIFTNGDLAAKTGDADTVDAGDGDDYVEVNSGDTNQGMASILAGTGADLVYVDGTTGGVSIDGQDDSDLVIFGANTTVDIPTGGKLEGGNGGNDVLVIGGSVDATIAGNIIGRSSGFESIRIDDNHSVVGFTNPGVAGRVDANANSLFEDTVAALTAKTYNLSGINKSVVVELNNGANTSALTIIGSTAADNITTGAANDTITGGDGSDVINLSGTGNDTVAITGGAAITGLTVNVDTISSFTAGAGTGSDIVNLRAGFLTGLDGGFAAAVSAGGQINVSNSSNDGDIWVDAATGSQVANVTEIGVAAVFASAASASTAYEAVYVTNDGSGNTNIWYVNDALDGNASDVSVTDVVLIGVLTSVTASSLVTGNFLVTT